MGEVDGPKISVNNMGFSGIQKQNSVPGEAAEQRTQINDFSDPKAEALGRSMLVKGNDNINNDLKVLIDNPQIADNSDEIFEAAYKAAIAAGAKNPYEEAVSVATTSM